jgi:hypothetical protein
MENYIECPCCGNKIRISYDDGKISVFFIAENQENLHDILQSKNIELGSKDGGDEDG